MRFWIIDFRMSKKHICFYSNSDKWSKAFLEELAKTKWLLDFEFVCVDPGPNRPTLPKWLKQVPTLVIQGDQEPIKTDTEVMNWLYEKKMKETPMKERSPQAAVLSGEPESWLGNEMSGMGSAKYSFVDSDTSVAGNGGAAIPGTFGFLNGGSSPGDRQGSSGATANITKTKKEQMFDQQMDLYMQNRDIGLKQPPARQ